MTVVKRKSCLGAGIGLRPAHLRDVIATRPAVQWFEVHICNFLGGGLNQCLLSQVAERYPLSAHSVSLNLGGADPLDRDYLGRLKQAVDTYDPFLISDHACFTRLDDRYFHDLLPVPYTADSAQHMARRISQVQDYLGRQILIENVSRYYSYPDSDLSEAEFLSAVCELSHCGLLLDLNNAWVNQHNHGETVDRFLASIPLECVGELHLAGHKQQDGRLIDTHDRPVSEPVWDIYRKCAKQMAQLPCLIEWDSNLPPLATLIGEAEKAEQIAAAATRSTGLETCVA